METENRKKLRLRSKIFLGDQFLKIIIIIIIYLKFWGNGIRLGHVNVIGPKVKASRRISYAVLKLLTRENILVLPMRLNMAFTAA